ncbi:MAG TPA: type IV-A pilus assembly ATPase PilB [Acidobacteriota bacterium]|jgi:type IV pilus assembly protein PilB|nr:type IV-A pilus assembly ATPase PilB [Acidobacteriota bacterium]
MTTRLGEVLIKKNMLTKDQLNEALSYQRQQGGKLGSILIAKGYVSDDEIATVLSMQYDVPSVNLEFTEVDPDVIKMVPIDTAIKYQLLPIKRFGTTLTVAITDPTNVMAMDDLKFMTGFNVEPVVASEGSIREAIEKYYGGSYSLELKKVYDQIDTKEKEDKDKDDYDLEVQEEEKEISIDQLQQQGEEAPIIKLANLILYDAIRRGASDIHVEPYEREYRVRYRIDGILYNVMSPPLRMRDAITSRLKIMSKLDISEKRVPQDGRIKIRINMNGMKKEIDFRVSVLPTLFGEKVVLRILDKEKLPLDLTKLGFEQSSLDRFQSAIAQPYGMVLVTGPTGSGKTSTLYTSINKLNTPEVNIITAEDPVEFNFAGINQVLVREQIGLTFAAALRSFLRQDPNIILVGEIRDFETAEIAVKAALTGHLVLSTLHTNDAPSSVSRLLNMGVEPFLVATSVNLICAQRLIRKVCSECRKEVSTPAKALTDIGFPAQEAPQIKTFKGEGCKNCNNTGYRGRVGLYEVMDISPALRDLILVGASASELKQKAREEGMLTLRESGLCKIRQGLTTIEEVLRETVRIDSPAQSK